jgi:choline dehydrogenase
VQADYIIVGAGSAGAALAYRLSEDPGTTVLLVEAGKPEHPYARMPASFGLFIDRPGVNWCYRSEPEPGTADRAIPVPRGKMLGGSSSLNGLLYVRGQTLDYDTWAQLGNRGWGWQDVDKIFRRMEGYDRGDSEARGSDGPLGITEVPGHIPLYDGLFAAAESVGLHRNLDYNGPNQDGIAKVQATIKSGRRMNTAACYLRPAKRRPNLRIVTEAMTQSLLLDGKRCMGIVYKKGGSIVEARCAKEVILSAGAIGSPQILELSGIGRPELLQGHGIAVNHELPGVGENFQDHMLSRAQWKITDPEASYNGTARGLRMLGQILRYATTGGGFLSLPAACMAAWAKTRPELETPDVQMQFVPYSVGDLKRRKVHPFPGMAAACFQLRPQSVGTIHIRSSDAREQPAIRFNFLDAAVDRQTMVDGFKIMRSIVEAEPMDPYRGEELIPGKSIRSDDEIESFIREKAETGFHPVSTCRMGHGAEAVVDDQLRVHGMMSLRVADASIFPTMPSGNTNAPSIMVGEKAADLIKGTG